MFENHFILREMKDMVTGQNKKSLTQKNFTDKIALI